MEEFVKALQQLATTFGAPTAIALCGWIWERRENHLMVKRLYKLAVTQTEASYKHEAALQALKAELK